MADLKISALTGASTPLAGTEVLPIVQSGSTVKVSVDNLTAGRAVSSGAVTASGNLRTQYSSAGNVSVIANNTGSASGATSQLIGLNDASRGLRIQYSSSGGLGVSALVNGVTTEAGQIFTDNNYPLLLGVNGSTAAIIDTSQNIKLINNLVIGTSGKGIAYPVYGGGSAVQPVFSATANTTQAINAATWTKVDFANELFDSNSNFASSTFTPTVPGYYQLNASVYWASDPGSVIVSIYRSGNPFVEIGRVTTSAGGTVNGSALVYAERQYKHCACYFQRRSDPRCINVANKSIFFNGHWCSS
jgi:hypothetical protein